MFKTAIAVASAMPVLLASVNDATAQHSTAEIRRLEEALDARGFNVGTPDGQLDSATRNAVRRFLTREGVRHRSGEGIERSVIMLLGGDAEDAPTSVTPGQAIAMPTDNAEATVAAQRYGVPVIDGRPYLPTGPYSGLHARLGLPAPDEAAPDWQRYVEDIRRREIDAGSRGERALLNAAAVLYPTPDARRDVLQRFFEIDGGRLDAAAASHGAMLIFLDRADAFRKRDFLQAVRWRYNQTRRDPAADALPMTVSVAVSLTRYDFDIEAYSLSASSAGALAVALPTPDRYDDVEIHAHADPKDPALLFRLPRLVRVPAEIAEMVSNRAIRPSGLSDERSVFLLADGALDLDALDAAGDMRVPFRLDRVSLSMDGTVAGIFWSRDFRAERAARAEGEFTLSAPAGEALPLGPEFVALWRASDDPSPRVAADAARSLVDGVKRQRVRERSVAFGDYLPGRILAGRVAPGDEDIARLARSLADLGRAVSFDRVRVAALYGRERDGTLTLELEEGLDWAGRNAVEDREALLRHARLENSDAIGASALYAGAVPIVLLHLPNAAWYGLDVAIPDRSGAGISAGPVAGHLDLSVASIALQRTPEGQRYLAVAVEPHEAVVTAYDRPVRVAIPDARSGGGDAQGGLDILGIRPGMALDAALALVPEGMKEGAVTTRLEDRERSGSEGIGSRHGAYRERFDDNRLHDQLILITGDAAADSPVVGVARYRWRETEGSGFDAFMAALSGKYGKPHKLSMLRGDRGAVVVWGDADNRPLIEQSFRGSAPCILSVGRDYKVSANRPGFYLRTSGITEACGTVLNGQLLKGPDGVSLMLALIDTNALMALRAAPTSAAEQATVAPADVPL